MSTVKWVISAAPEIFLLLSIALGTILGRVRIRGFSIGTTACTLIVAVLIGQREIRSGRSGSEHDRDISGLGEP